MYLIILFQEQPTQSINYLAIAISLLLGSILTILGFYVKSSLQRQSYKFEYYKKIIKKRLQVYELLENILRTLYIKDVVNYNPQFTPAEQTLVHSLFNNYESFKKFKQEFLSMSKNTFWFSEKLTIEFYNLNKLLTDIETTFDNNNPTSYVSVGIQYHGKLVNMYITLRKLHIADLKTLYNVEQFLNEHFKLLSDIKPISE